MTILLACSILSQYCNEINSQNAYKIWRQHHEGIIIPHPNSQTCVSDNTSVIVTFHSISTFTEIVFGQLRVKFRSNLLFDTGQSWDFKRSFDVSDKAVQNGMKQNTSTRELSIISCPSMING